MAYKKILPKQHPYKEKLKKLKENGKDKDARAWLDVELDKNNPEPLALLVAEMMQMLGME